MRIISYFPMIYNGIGPAYTAGSIASAMTLLGGDVAFFTPWSQGPWPKGVSVRSAARVRLPFKLVARTPLIRLAGARVERMILAEIAKAKEPVVLHLWPGASEGFIGKAKAAGALIVWEMINTHQGYAKRILDAESQRIGLPPQHRITAQSIAAEQACLQQCDLIFSPSDIVDRSLEAFGYAGETVGQVSFGWDPDKYAPAASPESAASPEKDGLTALFVGSVGMRKGAHFALEAWVQAGAPGRLVFLGKVEPDFRPILERYLGSHGIEHHDFVLDPQRFFHSADVFLFPTLEEGAPLVCYEAAGCGLPIVTTHAGTARIVEDGVNGRVFDAHSPGALVAAIGEMLDRERRAAMAASARESAARFTWRDAARERLRILGARMGN